MVLRGPTEDPSVAKVLLQQTSPPNMAVEIESVVLHQPLVGTCGSSSSSFVSEYDQTRFFAAQAERFAAQRCVSVIQAMSQLTKLLIKSTSSATKDNQAANNPNNILHLFRNIEMPLLFSVADAEFCGMPVSGEFFTRLRQGLKDRQELMEFYFHILCGKGFNADSHVDVSKLKKKIISDLVASFSDVIKDNYYQKNEGIEREETAWEYRPGTDGQGSGVVSELNDVIEKVCLKHHPMLRLVDEWRSLVRIPSLCTSILRCRHFDRVKPVYNTLGTDTGTSRFNVDGIIALHC